MNCWGRKQVDDGQEKKVEMVSSRVEKDSSFRL